MELQNFSHLIIEWDMSPEDAVILYLEWGNNDWHNKYPPVRSKNDFSNYFVVDNWVRTPPLVRLSTPQLRRRGGSAHTGTAR